MLPGMGGSGLDGTSTNAFGAPGSGSVGVAPIGTAFDADFPALANRVGNSQSSRTGTNHLQII